MNSNWNINIYLFLQIRFDNNLFESFFFLQDEIREKLIYFHNKRGV